MAPEEITTNSTIFKRQLKAGGLPRARRDIPFPQERIDGTATVN
jgi:hypothetical protein